MRGKRREWEGRRVGGGENGRVGGGKGGRWEGGGKDGRWECIRRGEKKGREGVRGCEKRREYLLCHIYPPSLQQPCGVLPEDTPASEGSEGLQQGSGHEPTEPEGAMEEVQCLAEHWDEVPCCPGPPVSL